MKKENTSTKINEMQKIMNTPVYDPILTTIIFHKHSGWEDEDKLKKFIKDKYRVLQGSFGKPPKTHFIKNNDIRNTVISLFKQWKECKNFKNSNLVYIFTNNKEEGSLKDLIEKIYQDNPENIITIIEEN